MGGTEVENSAIGVVKGSVFRSETIVGLGLINIIVLQPTFWLKISDFFWVRVGEMLQISYN